MLVRVRPSKKKPSLSTAVPLLVAVVSLLISLVTSYYQYFRESHDLEGQLSSIDPIYSKEVSGDILIVNRGNREEVMLKARYIFGSSSKSLDAALPESVEVVGPHVIKPSEAVVLHLKAVIPAGATTDSDKFGVEFLSIEPSGHIMSQVFQFHGHKQFVDLLHGGSIDD